MKKYIYIKSILILLAISVITSCAIDDDDAIIANPKTKIEAKTESKVVRIPLSENSYDATIKFSKPVTSFSRLSYALDGVEGEVDVAQGSSEVLIPVDMTNTIVKTITLNSFRILNADINNVESGISEEFNSLKIVKGDNTVIFTFTWNDDSDLDCGIIMRDSSGAITGAADVSQGVNTDVEVVVLGDSAPDREYFFTILPWTVNSNPLECYVEVIYGSEIKNFTANLVDALPGNPITGAYRTIEDFIKINKTTDPSTGLAQIDLEQILF